MTSPALSPALSGPQASMPIPLPGALSGPAPSPAPGAAGSFARQLQQAQSGAEPDAAARGDTSTETRRDAAAADPAVDGETTDGTASAEVHDTAAAKARALAARWLNLPGRAAGSAGPADDAGRSSADAAVDDRALKATEDKPADAATADAAAALIASLLPRTDASPAPRADAAAGTPLPADANGSSPSIAGLDGANTDIATATATATETDTKTTPPAAEDLAPHHGLALGHDRLAQATRNATAGDASVQALRDRLAPADDRAQPLTPLREARRRRVHRGRRHHHPQPARLCRRTGQGHADGHGHRIQPCTRPGRRARCRARHLARVRAAPDRRIGPAGARRRAGSPRPGQPGRAGADRGADHAGRHRRPGAPGRGQRPDPPGAGAGHANARRRAARKRPHADRRRRLPAAPPERPRRRARRRQPQPGPQRPRRRRRRRHSRSGHTGAAPCACPAPSTCTPDKPVAPVGV